MAVFNFEDATKWFEFEDGGKVQLQTVSAEKHKEIRRKAVKHRVDFKKVDGTPARFEYEETNEDLLSELFWDYAIVNWENFFDGKGNPIPCTKENKMLLIGNSVRFIKFVNEKLKELTEIEQEAARAEEKN